MIIKATSTVCIQVCNEVHTLIVFYMILWCFMCVVADHLHVQSFLQDFVVMHNVQSKSFYHTLEMWEIVSSKRFIVSTPCSQLQLVSCYFFPLICLEAGKDCWRASNISRYQEKTPRWARRSSGGRGQQERVIVSGGRFVRIGIFVRTVTVTCSARKFKIVNFTSEDSAATLPAFPFVGSTPNTSWVSKTGATSESFF